MTVVRTLLLLLSCLAIAPVISDSIFHQHLTKEVLLKLFDVAERELRIFIYPIPAHVEKYRDESPDQWQECTDRTFELHFCIEEIFIRYLEDVRDNFSAYPYLKTNFVTSKATHANAFVIDHTWVMKNSVENHLRPIIDNVVDNYPYYNQSNGHDHFLVYPYDFGVLCSGRHLREDWSEIDNCPVDEKLGHKYFCHVSRIINTSFIGNYGMDAKYYDENDYTFGLKKCIGECPKVVCFRPTIDIVTPQYLTADTNECYVDLSQNGSLYIKRAYDTCFRGNYRYQRFILEKMKRNAAYNYHHNQTDLYKESDDLLNCIFAYHMCGQACWSQRLYDALALGAIPIIVADGAIQAFERFLDWRKFSIKISVSELFQDQYTFRFRRILRKQSDIYRRTLKSLLASSALLSYEKDPDPKQTSKKGFILHKMFNVRSSVEWFNFRDLKNEVNAFRVLVLEMFCRIVRKRTSFFDNMPRDAWNNMFIKMSSSTLANDVRFHQYICWRRPDFISRLRYVA